MKQGCRRITPKWQKCSKNIELAVLSILHPNWAPLRGPAIKRRAYMQYTVGPWSIVHNYHKDCIIGFRSTKKSLNYQPCISDISILSSRRLTQILHLAQNLLPKCVNSRCALCIVRMSVPIVYYKVAVLQWERSRSLAGAWAHHRKLFGSSRLSGNKRGGARTQFTSFPIPLWSE